MSPLARVKQFGELLRWFLAAVLIVALGTQQNATAASISRAKSSASAEQHCKCGTKCHGRSCCCAGGDKEARSEPPEPSSQSGRADASPCVDSAPCGDSAMPNGAPSSPVKASVALAMHVHPTNNNDGRVVRFSHFCILPTERASRLERPPKASASPDSRRPPRTHRDACPRARRACAGLRQRS